MKTKVIVARALSNTHLVVLFLFGIAPVEQFYFGNSSEFVVVSFGIWYLCPNPRTEIAGPVWHLLLEIWNFSSTVILQSFSKGMRSWPAYAKSVDLETLFEHH